MACALTIKYQFSAQKFSKMNSQSLIFVLFLTTVRSIPTQSTLPISTSIPTPCTTLLSQKLKSEISSYQPTANLIFQTILNGPFKGRTYNDLAYMVDTIGPRVLGSKGLNQSIDFLLDKMTKDGLQNVHGEVVTVSQPIWTRGFESAELVTPRRKKMSILGLGNTVGTPGGGIHAPVLVVRSFEELEEKAEQASGKIIVFNPPFIKYGISVQYRLYGASRAAKVGALAALIRSVTPLSINSPHTGDVEYEENVDRIPTASITVGDAELLDRLQSYGMNLTLKLVLQDTFTNGPIVSRNTIGEIVGREKPDHLVILSGHLDSWDVGQGAMDNGGGCLIAVEALALLRHLNLSPRRTLRTVLWTGEEFGYFGSLQYAKDHEQDNVTAFFESDYGVFRPIGLDFAGDSDEAGCIVREILSLMEPWNVTVFRRKEHVGSDISVIRGDVPGVSVNTEDGRYLWFHHTEGDTMSVMDEREMDLCMAVWAVASFVVADLSVELPRK